MEYRNYMDKIIPGALLGKEKFNWIAGANSPIVPQKILVDDWKKYAPEHEIQVVNVGESDQYDKSDCVTESATDCFRI